ncbi:polysaccharide deacetylase family protein [Halomicrobium sp. IBSBa]|uniref:polysaccharide deacetylase family protein n=1 Tax=Halomicrobium sp. IBSBa TaxID=2778916 RepID=UPI001ABFC175|nr:polysaccharide deacetylase family protein [Halomicrobium sp. IBSBa]MBO4246977.1 polysaccharide deacetylase family protein [Halomicrobium sp. IBSBa]
MSDWVPGDAEFALCLTHDVDRPYKTYQSLYYTVAERDPSHLLDLLPWRNPYWTFEDIVSLEGSLGVRSAFYFLSEQSLFRDRSVSEWTDAESWRLYAGRYDLGDPDIAQLMSSLDDQGWEVGLHGSYESYREPSMLEREKQWLEETLGRAVRGGRQHYLNLERPTTWRYQRSMGLQYDASPGSSAEFGFQDGYLPFRPFDDHFVVFPTVLMECALPNPGEEYERAWAACRRLLDEACDHEGVMTVLWHPRYFSSDYDGYTELYRELIECALDMGAWVGPPGQLYEHWQDDRAQVPTPESERATQ